jgi:hypothetical protein
MSIFRRCESKDATELRYKACIPFGKLSNKVLNRVVLACWSKASNTTSAYRKLPSDLRNESVQIIEVPRWAIELAFAKFDHMLFFAISVPHAVYS